jgi:hypothetical protein
VMNKSVPLVYQILQLSFLLTDKLRISVHTETEGQPSLASRPYDFRFDRLFVNTLV